MIFMPAGKIVRMSDSTMGKLAKVRNGFESPNDCINRLLSQNPCKKEMKDSDEESELESRTSHEVE